MSLQETIEKAAAQAVKELYGAEISPNVLQVQRTNKEFKGHLTLVVFPILKLSRKKPQDTAEELGSFLRSRLPEVVCGYNVVKGFLNLEISSACWAAVLCGIYNDSGYGVTKAGEGAPLVMIEYSSPNTNKPLHLGHVRNNLLGCALANIIAANGCKVVKTNIVNDRGIHICKSMLAWKKFAGGATPQSAGQKGDHFVGDYYVAFENHYKQEVKELVQQGMTEAEAKTQAPIIREAHEMLVKWEQNDAETRALWREMNEWVYAGFEETYKALGVSFDKIYYESETYLEGKAKVLEGLDKGLFTRKADGSVWADLTAEGLDEKLLLRSDGTSVYMTQDIGTAEQRFRDYPIDKMIYVVGNEQNYHFQVLAILLDKLGFEWGKGLIHFSYGMVELPNGKMKSREGTVVDADDLIAEMIGAARRAANERTNKPDDVTEEEASEIARIVGLGALKYFILKVDARKNMLFNPDESIDFNGNTGPFIQYAYARIRSVLRKARAAGLNIPSKLQDVALNDKEISLVCQLIDFPSVVKAAGSDYNPSCIANYCYDLVKEYNQFYHDFSILHETDENKRAFRLMLSATVGMVIKKSMGLLGIEVPEKM